MPNDAFSTLGLTRGASLPEARAAYRRLALQHHPDRCPGDTEAAERFMRILAAYRAVNRALRDGGSRAPKVGPRPDRFACGSCGDRFPFPEACSRCGVALHDCDSGPIPSPAHPEVQAMMDELLARPEPSDEPSSALIPGYLVGGCLAASALVWGVGPVGPALLFAGFAAYVAGVELHRRATAPALA